MSHYAAQGAYRSLRSLRLRAGGLIFPHLLMS